MRRWIPVLVLAVVLLVLLALFGPWPTRPTPEVSRPVSRAQPVPARTPTPSRGRPAARAVESVEEPVEEPPGPGSTVEAHHRIAEALGGVSIRCWVGTQLDGTGIWGGRYAPRIENGWYSDVVSTLQGRQMVMEEPDANGDNEGKPLFEVRWEAEEAPSTVPCEVIWPDYAELVVRAVDDEGAPVEGVTIGGCSIDGHTDADGVLRRSVVVTESCLLMGHVPPWRLQEGEGLPRDQRVIRDLVQGEVREVELLMRPPSAEDPMERPPPGPDPVWVIDPGADADELDRRAEEVRALRPGTSSSEAETLDAVIEMLEMNARMRRNR